MPSNKRQRELARRRAERQAARRAAERAARRKKRMRLGLSLGGAALGVILILVLVAVMGGDDDGKVEPEASASATPSGPCAVSADPEAQTGGKKPGNPPDPAFGNVTRVKGDLVLKQGPLELTLFADKAPCTVNSFKHLAAQKFFDGGKCHRQTNTPGLVVLQCGDPTATGSGGPGYQFKDENLPAAGADGTASYPRGTVAMANSGPGTNGSQFFLVIKDSKLPPNYTIFGQVTKGLDVLDKIQATGIKDKAQDGPPAQDVTITSFKLTDLPGTPASGAPATGSPTATPPATTAPSSPTGTPPA